jgi:hypothetical protein
MKNWVIQGLRYDIKPSPYNYIKSRWSHFHFCKKEDPTITASLYLDNLAGEIIHEISRQTSVNKKSLTLSVVKKVLENKKAKQELVALFEKREITPNEKIKEFLDKIAPLIQNTLNKDEHLDENEETSLAAELPVRTYVIATHIYLELNNNELHYETLIRDTTALKEFITTKFKTGKLSARLADMKNFSYKKILAGKNNDGARGQLKPQLKQIVANPSIFGKEVSVFAEKILKDYFEM